MENPCDNQKFNDGSWYILPNIFEGYVIGSNKSGDKDHPDRDIIATQILNWYDARLIAAAPFMYSLLKYALECIQNNTYSLLEGDFLDKLYGMFKWINMSEEEAKKKLKEKKEEQNDR